MGLVRLNKYLKDLDICSRRKADEFIAKGYVFVNGVMITELGYKVNPLLDKVELSPELAAEKAGFCYIVLNKPRGFVCTKSTIDGDNIFSLLPKIDDLTYAGRLDKDSHGLVVVSNDGKFVYNIAGKEFGIEKEYIVRVDHNITANFLLQQSNGSIRLEGKRVRPAKVEQINLTTYRIILTEGINRQIRRMAENQGYRVIDLQRVRIGKITAANLKVGQWRDLTESEIKCLF